ncbi:hypothetical protein GOP47_0017061 [Adiantum capillus-veneris]|uniref:Uncharacterized protein n=1 Tax=Adiantum capillus-veneris TaxID=13818 RepID=A0A9D4UJT5_ADICA|nr:hypothetical protein GOP47_0017061 [Adiantum capillus-veneris]
MTDQTDAQLVGHEAGHYICTLLVFRASVVILCVNLDSRVVVNSLSCNSVNENCKGTCEPATGHLEALGIKFNNCKCEGRLIFGGRRELKKRTLKLRATPNL